MKDRLKLLTIIGILLLLLSTLAARFDFVIMTIYILAFTTLYLLFIFLCHIFKQLKSNTNTSDNTDYNPFISIIIPCHNEENVLEATVKNILAVDYSNYEIILVDDRSTDNTAEVIKRIAPTNEKIKYLIRDMNNFPGKSAALNEVMDIAQGEAILVFDADAKINPDFIKKILIKFKPDDIAAVQAKKVIVNREQNLLTRCQYNQYIFDSFVQDGRDTSRGAVELRGNGEIIKRAAIDDIGGWNNKTITDDLDLSTKLHVHGWNIRFCPEVEVYEEGLITYPALLKQGRRWAEGGVRRFLTYTRDFFFSRKISLKVAIDIVSYLVLFISPLWLLVGLLLVCLGKTNLYMYVLSLLITVICVECLFGFSLFWALKKYSNTKVWHPFKDIFVTSLYIAAFWIPLVFVIILKIIFMPKTMTWGNTVHGVVEQNKTND